MVKFESNVRVDLESEFGKCIYTRVAGLENYVSFIFGPWPNSVQKLTFSNGQIEPNVGSN